MADGRVRFAAGALALWSTALAGLLCVALGGCGGGEEDHGPPPNGATQRDSGAVTPTVGSQTVRLVSVEPAPRPTGPLPEGASCVTAECHARFASAKHIHSPVGTGRCDACHEPDAGGHTYPLRRTGNDTCNFCHEASGEGDHVHAPMDDPGCLACHDPHAAAGEFLLPAGRVDQLCNQCHAVPLKRFVHGPVADGNCTLCHEPHRGGNAMLLRGGTGISHCATCHRDMVDRLAEATFLHPPTSDCTNCHESHTAGFAHLLRQSVRANCAECHPAINQIALDAAVQHQAVTDADSCVNCHDPHGSTHPAILDASEGDLCVSCHNRTVTTADGRRVENVEPELKMPFLHGPVRDGDCAACHNVHGAPFPALLTKSYPEMFYTSFDLDKYELCFSCHQSDLVMQERTTALTGFRDGDLNLHYVHVHREQRGRTCRTCHATHGSDRPRHMAESVPFQGSDWMMPIEFEKTDDGGRCTPGCHELMTYTRDRTAAASPDGAPDQGGEP